MSSTLIYPPVAQLDNAADSDSEERGFKSLWAGQLTVRANFLGKFTFLKTIRDLNPRGSERKENSPVDCF